MTISKIASLPLGLGENGIYCSVIDSENRYIYFGTVMDPPNPQIAKIRISDFTEVDNLVLSSGTLGSACIDRDNGFTYFGQYNKKII